MQCFFYNILINNGLRWIVDKRTKILEVAKTLFLQQGYKSTSIQSIATEAGISKGAVYLYFRSKEDILLSIFRMIEARVWHKIEKINQNGDLTARDKYRLQIVTFYNEIMENLQFNQMMLNESAVELNEAFYAYAREYRYRLQKSQEASLLNIYGDKLSPWISDIVVSVNGVMQEFDASIVLDNLELTVESLADFICNITEYLVQGILADKPEPLFDESTRLKRDAFLEQQKDQKRQRIEQGFQQLSDRSHSLDLSADRKAELQETLVLIKEALQEKEINKTLVRALTLNLGEFSELKKEVSLICDLLEIKN